MTRIEKQIRLEIDKMSTDSEIEITPFFSIEQKLIMKAADVIFDRMQEEMNELKKELKDNGVI